MTILRFIFVITILLSGLGSLHAQQLFGSSSAAPMPQIDEPELSEIDDNPTTKFTFFDEIGSAIGLQTGNFYLGFKTVFEQELDPGFYVKDMVVYDLNLTYNLGDFTLNFMCENFLNLNQREAGILPDLTVINGVIHQTSYELDSPFLVAVAMVVTF